MTRDDHDGRDSRGALYGRQNTTLHRTHAGRCKRRGTGCRTLDRTGQDARGMLGTVWTGRWTLHGPRTRPQYKTIDRTLTTPWTPYTTMDAEYLVPPISTFTFPSPALLDET